MQKRVGIKFKSVGKIYFFAPGQIYLKVGDHVIVETARGLEYGTVASKVRSVQEDTLKHPVKPVLRKGTPEDAVTNDNNLRKAVDAMKICQQQIEKDGLAMKLIRAEYTFDSSKVIFYFTADGRIDFRELVKELAGIFRIRIELRQIGVRDEAKMIGGVGNCGRGLCCNTWLRDFEPVSIKMAKVQNLSLNPTKISGICGRLMCCLKYENDIYNELKKGMPNVGERVRTSDGTAVVTDVNILENLVKTRLVLEEASKENDNEEKLSTEFYSYGKEELKRLGKKNRNGKGKGKDRKDDDLTGLDPEQLKEIEKLLKD